MNEYGQQEIHLTSRLQKMRRRRTGHPRKCPHPLCSILLSLTSERSERRTIGGEVIIVDAIITRRKSFKKTAQRDRPRGRVKQREEDAKEEEPKKFIRDGRRDRRTPGEVTKGKWELNCPRKLEGFEVPCKTLIIISFDCNVIKDISNEMVEHLLL